MNFFRGQFSIIFLLLFAGYNVANIIDANGGSALQDNGKNSSPLDIRLPKTIIPTSYEIILVPQLEGNFTFNGRAHINAFVQESTDTIILHHGRLNITMVSVYSNKEEKQITNKKYNDETEKFEIKLAEVLKAGVSITINFEYAGVIRDDMVGFYKSSYIDSNGKVRWMLSTQFQKSYARYAFPCFDEPRFKATFIIRLLRPEGYTCLSNMPLNRSIKVGDLFWDEFKQSIPMSTYLVAFVISDFKSVKVGDFKVWARPNAIDQGKYALTIGTQALDHLSKRFKQNYQISKMDMVAVPDFAMGAMENWGLVTYREGRLLYDEKTTSDAAKQSIASVIVHELTHMWFGNTITPEWWSYLWLSEAFARYFEYFGTAQIEKSWNMEEQFVVAQHQTAYAADGVETSQPMTRDVSNSSQMDGIADKITYNKGGSIVRMMNLIFGSDIFDAGLQNYLNNEEKVAFPKHLWLQLQQEINRHNKQLAASVEEIMTTWTEQAGFPVVNVSIENGKATLTQQRFLLRNLKSTPTNIKWWIPIMWATKENPNFDKVNVAYWFSKERDTIEIDKSSGWVIFNVQSAGFYRVNYDNASWYRIIDALNSKNYEDIHVLNRAALVDDLLNLARAELLAYKTALDGLRYLTQEKNYLPFKAAFSGLTYLDQRLSGHDEYYKLFKEFVLLLIKDRYKEIGYVDRPSDDRLTILLRGELNKWACNYGHKGCIENFTRMFQLWKEHNIPIKPNQAPIAYCMGVKYGTVDDWEFLWNHYYNSNSATEQMALVQALGCTQNTALWEKYLLYALKPFEESRIRMHDNSAAFSAVYGSGVSGAEFLLNFVGKYYAEMTKFYNGTGTISSILSSASQHFSTRELVKKFEDLMEQRKVEFGGSLKSLKNSLDIAKYELLWFEKNAKQIISWVNAFNAEHQANSTTDTTDYRLPTSITPNSYTIWVTTDLNELDNFTFTGSVNIYAVVKQKTKNIVLHSASLTHSSISVLAEGKQIDVLKSEKNEKYDFLIIELGKELQVGQKLNIAIKFAGHLNEEMRGFYRSSYVDDNGETRWLAATHMEPVAARKMFPCFDEPAMKATFTMNVTVSQNYTAVSNMPIDNIYLHSNEMKTIVFKETPKMSTYLVALVISDFASMKDDDDVYGVWAKKSVINQGKYALSAMKPLVDYYGKTLDIPYQLPKLDMVALPDFVSGAMENWGLLTYKERNVLYDPDLSTTASQQTVMNIISHEITHQWFGNLVSPLWWKYLWLNEGFARYFQFFGTHGVQPDWSLESQFVVEHIHSAFEADSAASTHAMSHDVYSPTEISGIFDTISYAKAASVIRMMEKVFGRDIFYKSLQSYLKKRQYDAAAPEDLFNSFKEQITDQEIKNSFHDIMNSWTAQPGYPVVHVAIQGNRLELKQERFYLKPQEAKPQTTWYVPITWTPMNKPDFEDTKPKYWFKDAQDSVALPSDDLYLVNVQQSGFYRTNYDTQTWKKIINFLKSNEFDKIHEINRAALIDDLLNLGRSGHVDYDIVLSATQYLSNETSYIPWRAFFNGLTYLYKQFEGRDGFDAFKRYVGSILTPIYDNLGFDDQPDDSHDTKLFKSHVRTWACKLDISDCKAQALVYYKLSNSVGVRIPANYLGVIYCTVARQNNPHDWEILWTLYSSSKFPAEKSIILQSLACTTEKAFLTELLGKAISKHSDIRFQDSSSVFTSVINASPEGVECVIDFVKDNYSKMIEYYEEMSSVSSIVNAIGKKVFTVEHYVKYVQLLNWLEERRPAKHATMMTFANRGDHALKWAESNIPRLNEWFEKNYPRMDYRLPKTFSPLKYNISLSPYFEEKNFAFTGSVQIQLRCTRNYVSHIVLHANELKINKVSVYPRNPISTNEKELEISSIELNNVSQTLSIFMKNFIKSEELVLDIDFTGTLNDKMLGFYRSYYVNSEGNIRWLAATQFEATYARSAFPCFDEPAFKATFVVNIERPKDYIVLSNMPRALLTPSEAPGRVWESFKETVKMSTYLVAFVVSDFNRVRDSNEVVNVWGRPEIVGKGDLAQIIASRVLTYLYLDTGHKYTLPKLDLVGIPDFSMGAMENWGLATFREYGLFYDKNVTTAKYQDYIVTIISHELAHMLYGNLVTCDWWEYIWLNEGFAQYMQWRLAYLFRPTFGFEDLFVVNELQAAMQSDGLPSTHPMNNPVSKPSDIQRMFDTVTYGKSSSVIRMIRKSMQPKIFVLAMYQYILRHRFDTTTPKDLWKAFDDTIKETGGLGDWDMPMEKLMDGWTNKRGYPVVVATLEGNHVTLTQKSFFTYEDIQDFIIPITLTTASELNFATTWTDVWLADQPLKIYIDKPNEWFLVNIQQSGYYRVNYDEDSWFRLIDALKKKNHSMIHVTNRAQIIDDLLNLARSGYVDYTVALNGTSYLQNETNYLPWKAFLNGMSFILQRYKDQKGEDLVKKYTLLLATELYEKIGFVDVDFDSHFDQLSRELILSWMCKLGHKECVQQARELFNKWRKDGTEVSPNARPAVYCTGIKHGSEEDWEFLWQQYLKTNFASEKVIILNALGCSQDKKILNTYIEYALIRNYTSPIRKQDVSTVLASVYNADKFGLDLMLDFLVQDYKKIYEYYGDWDGVEQLITKMAPHLSTVEQISRLDQLQSKEIDHSSLTTAINSAIKTAKNNIDWYEEYSSKISDWLSVKIPTMQGKNAGGIVAPNSLGIISTTVFTIIMYILTH